MKIHKIVHYMHTLNSLGRVAVVGESTSEQVLGAIHTASRQSDAIALDRLLSATFFRGRKDARFFDAIRKEVIPRSRLEATSLLFEKLEDHIEEVMNSAAGPGKTRLPDAFEQQLLLLTQELAGKKKASEIT